jgi:hypothetical protein
VQPPDSFQVERLEQSNDERSRVFTEPEFGFPGMVAILVGTLAFVLLVAFLLTRLLAR